MRLVSLHAEGFRSLRDTRIDQLGDLTIFIGANASGKSTLLDALRLLAEALREGDFERPVMARGGITQLCGKRDADTVSLVSVFADGERSFEWHVRLVKYGFGFVVSEEQLRETGEEGEKVRLESREGSLRYWSEQGRGESPQLKLQIPPTACALTRAAEDGSFPGREVAAHVRGWTFFDPSPDTMRRPSEGRGDHLDPLGRNLASRILYLQEQDKEQGGNRLEQIVTATRDVVGVPERIWAKQGDDGRVYLVQAEDNLRYVSQQSISSGTLRVLAFMTALLGDDDVTLVGIEEPENYVHPAAIRAFAAYLRKASVGHSDSPDSPDPAGKGKQIMVTTHSPLLLNCLPRAREVRIVLRTADGTAIESAGDPDAIEKALEESGFGLGEFLETRGFGS